jgi:hypothetical protein
LLLANRVCIGTVGNKIVFTKYWTEKSNPGKWCYSKYPFDINTKLVPKVKAAMDLMIKQLNLK